MLNRRDLLRGRMPAAAKGRPQLLFRPQTGPAGDVFVCVFLRGGMDGLNVVVPYGDPDYYRQRPTLGIAEPGRRGSNPEARAIDLDGFFGLHPNVKPLQAAYQAGDLAIVQAIGTPDKTRSHFEAMETMERGVDDGSTASTGWLGRHLGAIQSSNRSPMRAIALGDVLPQSLQGAIGATAVNSLDDFRLVEPAGWNGRFHATVTALYGDDDTSVGHAGVETLGLLKTMSSLNTRTYAPANGAKYPGGDFGSGLKQIAQLIKAEVGLEVACLDLGGWDSHVGQFALMGYLMPQLGEGLAAFHADLGEGMKRVTLVAMSEFGRRAYENTSLGTDHGRATCMFVLGGGINGGRVIRKWPGLAADLLEEGDLRVTMDYRDVLGEIVRNRMKNPRPETVFPQHNFTFAGVTRTGQVPT